MACPCQDPDLPLEREPEVVDTRPRPSVPSALTYAPKATYEGGCHCGRVRFRVVDDLSRVTECNCSICTKKGYLHVIVSRERFELLSGESELVTYTFNTGVAKHHFCRTCGIHSFYAPQSDPDKVDVNARCLDGVDLDAIDVSPFDGRNWEEAIQTRPPWRD